MSNKQQSRRDFLSTVTLGTLGTFGAAGVLKGCSDSNANSSSIREDPYVSLRDRAPDGEPLKAGLVGCGGRGSGAAVNFLDAGPNLEIVALGDAFQDQLDKCRTNLNKARGVEVADENCYVGFDAYQKVIDSGVDIVLFATPPHFRPMHVRAAIEAGKHVFQEKPVAVDPVGARMMMETTQQAKEKELVMVSGTVHRYQRDYIETRERVRDGAIGEVVGATFIRNGGALWWVDRKPGWSDMEYMLRNWGNFAWLSGDHIVEMFIHQLDTMSWHMGSHPVKAVGYGGRQQRVSGDQFDQFSIVYEYENGKKAHCATRQINDCDNRMQEMITGTEGYIDATGAIYNHDGEVVWEYPYPDEEDAESQWHVTNPFVQEHIELVTAIRTGNYHNDSEEQVKSSRIAIMGRMAAYTGEEITWDEVVNSDLRLGPDTYEFGPVEGIPEEPPVVGTAPAPTDRYS
ncbi:Predicted dehydrogenase [Fodinibius roseus]|uniref:Predicted dehydrogenase n=1 Tax=Fodinibius roseus TaxID=1194090 RepID=A0A1M5IXL5_9BACT|nr:Gfo/Idh/MocA family oxidoreductase [Fodinibius roseus]SHG33046.1 Predicted dehydrogenase [Fodinibius roseus]